MSHSFIDYPSSGPDQGIVRDLSPSADPGSVADAITGSLKRLYDRIDDNSGVLRRSRGSDRLVAVSSMTQVQGSNFYLNIPGNDGLATTGTSLMIRASFALPYGATVIQPVFANNFCDINGPGDTALDPFDVRCSIEDAAGGIYDLTVNGSSTGHVDGGGRCAFDPCSIRIPVGGSVVLRYHLSFAAGARIAAPFSGDNNSKVTGLGFEDGGTDKTRGSTVSSSQTVGAYGCLPIPIVLLGRFAAAAPRQASVLVIGDSISPPITQALAGVMPIHPIRESGQSYASFNSHQGRYRLAQAGYTTHAITQVGINDVRGNNAITLGDLQAAATSLWDKLYAAGNRMTVVTITPYTNSTDGWTTTVNQTPLPSEGARAAYNDWLRTLPHPGVVNVVDWADICESSRNSGLWKPNVTDDGTHPTGVGDPNFVGAPAAMRDAISPTLFA